MKGSGMTPEVKNIFSTDIDNLSTYEPKNKKCFGFQLRVIVGPKGEEGEESLDFTVCTPDWIALKHGEHAVFSGANSLIVFNYDIENIKNKIVELVKSCEGRDWKDCGTKMSKFGLWEFESYRDDSFT